MTSPSAFPFWSLVVSLILILFAYTSALTLPLHAWQNQQPTDYRMSGTDFFYQWCDVLENLGPNQYNTAATPLAASPSAVQSMLGRWASWFTSTLVNAECPGTGGKCFSTYDYNSPAYTNISVDNAGNRAWLWLTCTELGFFQGRTLLSH